MEKWLKCYAPYTFSTSPHSCYRSTLLNTKVPNLTASQENCEKNYVRTLSYFHQFNNCWQIHDKIAETLCLVLKVCPAPRTQALIRRMARKCNLNLPRRGKNRSENWLPRLPLRNHLWQSLEICPLLQCKNDMYT